MKVGCWWGDKDDQGENKVASRSVGVKGEMSINVNGQALKWFRHVEQCTSQRSRVEGAEANLRFNGSMESKRRDAW